MNWPIARGLGLHIWRSLLIALGLAVVALISLADRATVYPAAQRAANTGTDLFTLLVALLLLACLWLARRGSSRAHAPWALAGLLLWPGALFYLVYIYSFYAVALFNGLFLAYLALVAMSAVALVSLVAAIDADAVARRLEGRVPARLAGGVLVALGLLFAVIDAAAALQALQGGAPLDPAQHAAWIVDLALECPALIAGGVLLWLRRPLGYAWGAALLLKISLLIVGVPVGAALGAWLTGAPFDPSSLVLLALALAPLAVLASFVRAADGRAAVAAPQLLS